MKTLIISNEEMNDIMEIVKSLAESGLLIIAVTERIQNPAKKQKWIFIGLLSCTLGVSFF